MSYTYDEEEDAIEKASRQAFLDTQAKVVELQAKLILATKSKDEWESKLKEKQKEIDIKEKEANAKLKAVHNGLHTIRNVENELLEMRKSIQYFEENAELVWKRKLKVADYLKKSKDAVNKTLKRNIYVCDAHDLLIYKQLNDKLEKKYNELLKKYDERIQDEENMPDMNPEVMREIQTKFEVLETELEKERADKLFYKSNCDEKVVKQYEDSKVNRIRRRSLSEVSKNPELNKEYEIINKHNEQKQILTIFKPKQKSKKNKSKRS